MKFINNPDTLDQHFLIDQKVIDTFIKSCNLNKDDIVLEIGPGTGVLTRVISSKVKRLYIIEKDERLREFLDNIPNTKITYESCLNIKFPKVDKIITSLPYSIIEPFIYKIINEDFKELYMIMGKTYCDNVIENNITNLSLLTNTFFNTKRIIDIAPSSFNPPPKTYSSLIKITKKSNPTKKELLFQNIYKLDDKLVKNTLLESLIIINNLTKREAKELIKSFNIDEKILNQKFSTIDNTSLKDLYNKINI